MNEHVKDCIAKVALIWIITGAVLTLPAACSKAVHAFYHQVIAKDQVVGEPIKK